jgi:hypothetical protein
VVQLTDVAQDSHVVSASQCKSSAAGKPTESDIWNVWYELKPSMDYLEDE